jgi:hypothetical protein
VVVRVPRVASTDRQLGAYYSYNVTTGTFYGVINNVSDFNAKKTFRELPSRSLARKKSRTLTGFVKDTNPTVKEDYFFLAGSNQYTTARGINGSF